MMKNKETEMIRYAEDTVKAYGARALTELGADATDEKILERSIEMRMEHEKQLLHQLETDRTTKAKSAVCAAVWLEVNHKVAREAVGR